MNLEEIINAAVEKRVAEIVRKCVGSDEPPHVFETDVELQVRLRAKEIVVEELKKHEDRIRLAVAAAVGGTTIGEVTAYMKFTIPATQGP